MSISRPCLLSRVRGSLAAALAGDCFGAPFESGPPVDVDTVLELVKKREKKYAADKQRAAEGKTDGPTDVLEYTDDTAMVRCIAASLVEHRSVNVKDIGARFAEEFKTEPHRGYGGSVITVLRALGDPSLADIFQPARDQFDGSGSYGNGGGMRIAPVGLFCHGLSFKELQDHTLAVTRLTHTNPLALAGSLLQSCAVSLALAADNTKPLDAEAFLDNLIDQFKPAEQEIFKQCIKENDKSQGKEDSERNDPGLPYCDKLDIVKEFLDYDVGEDEVKEKLGTDVTALGSIPTAVHCFLREASQAIAGMEEHSPIEQTIVYAISLGGDTDTIATMAGAMAGAFYGLDHLPLSWQHSCEGIEDALLFGKQIADTISSRQT